MYGNTVWDKKRKKVTYVRTMGLPHPCLSKYMSRRFCHITWHTYFTDVWAAQPWTVSLKMKNAEVFLDSVRPNSKQNWLTDLTCRHGGRRAGKRRRQLWARARAQISNEAEENEIQKKQMIGASQRKSEKWRLRRRWATARETQTDRHIDT